jgi:hypothetical protein
LIAIVVAGFTVEARAARLDTRGSESVGIAPLAADTTACCGYSGAPNFGVKLDFDTMGEGTEVTTQYRNYGVLFGLGASPLAADTYVLEDYSRPQSCRLVLNGDPPFGGWEFMIFVDPVSSHWAKVQKIGATIGYCDRPNSCFIAAYDGAGQLLEARFNEDVGFQFLSIDRPSADISIALVGDCQGGGGACYPDPGGSALNCLTFSPPVIGAAALPDTVHIPNPPFIQGTPVAGREGLLALGFMLATAAALMYSRMNRKAETGQS